MWSISSVPNSKDVGFKTLKVALHVQYWIWLKAPSKIADLFCRYLDIVAESDLKMQILAWCWSKWRQNDVPHTGAWWSGSRAVNEISWHFTQWRLPLLVELLSSVKALVDLGPSLNIVKTFAKFDWELYLLVHSLDSLDTHWDIGGGNVVTGGGTNTGLSKVAITWHHFVSARFPQCTTSINDLCLKQAFR